jgi:hypothetical protein
MAESKAVSLVVQSRRPLKVPMGHTQQARWRRAIPPDASEAASREGFASLLTYPTPVGCVQESLPL